MADPYDETQDAWIKRLEERVDGVETEQKEHAKRLGDHDTKHALAEAAVASVSKAVDTGMIDIKAVMAATITKRDEDDREARQAEVKERDKQRAADKWWWTKAFGAIISVATVLGGGGATAWLAMDDKPQATPAPISAPAPAPAPDGE